MILSEHIISGSQRVRIRLRECVRSRGSVRSRGCFVMKGCIRSVVSKKDFRSRGCVRSGRVVYQMV